MELRAELEKSNKNKKRSNGKQVESDDDDDDNDDSGAENKSLDEEENGMKVDQSQVNLRRWSNCEMNVRATCVRRRKKMNPLRTTISRCKKRSIM